MAAKLLMADKKEDLVAKIEQRTNVSSIKEVDSLLLSGGRVYISEGDLMFDRL